MRVCTSLFMSVLFIYSVESHITTFIKFALLCMRALSLSLHLFFFFLSLSFTLVSSFVFSFFLSLSNSLFIGKVDDVAYLSHTRDSAKGLPDPRIIICPLPFFPIILLSADSLYLSLDTHMRRSFPFCGPCSCPEIRSPIDRIHLSSIVCFKPARWRQLSP